MDTGSSSQQHFSSKGLTSFDVSQDGFYESKVTSAGAVSEVEQRAPPGLLSRRLDRYLKTIPVVAFGITLTASWEATANGFQSGLLNGGPASMTWGFLLAIFGTLMIVLSLAEMASMYVSDQELRVWERSIAGPQYTVRDSWTRDSSALCKVFAWIAAATLLPYFTGSQICGLLILNYPDYHYQGWHATLLGYATILIPLLFNIFARKTLRPVEVIGAILHFLFFVVFMVVLPTLGGQNRAEYVFFASSDGASGWHNPTIEWCIGLLSAVFPLTAFDGVLHLSDEVKNPETRIPKAMVVSFIINAVLAFGFMITLLFFMGSPEKALESKTYWPIIQICFQAANNLKGANALMSMIIIPGIISYFNNMASVSRLTWAFARDDGLPFSSYFKRVHPRLRIPIRAIGLTTVITMLLLLIPIGSETAFNAILSLAVIALYFSYTLPCIFVFLQRLTGESVAHSQWSLGRWGIWVNGLASVYGIFIIIWLAFPTTLPVTAANMNWSGPIMGFVILFALVDWYVRARHRFVAPTEKDELY